MWREHAAGAGAGLTLGARCPFPGVSGSASPRADPPVLSPPQTERAYQKQPTIFQNKKRVLLGEGGKEKLPRYYRNVGLGFKTPKEVRGAGIGTGGPGGPDRGLAFGDKVSGGLGRAAWARGLWWLFPT